MNWLQSVVVAAAFLENFTCLSCLSEGMNAEVSMLCLSALASKLAVLRLGTTEPFPLDWTGRAPASGLHCAVLRPEVSDRVFNGAASRALLRIRCRRLRTELGLGRLTAKSLSSSRNCKWPSLAATYDGMMQKPSMFSGGHSSARSGYRCSTLLLCFFLTPVTGYTMSNINFDALPQHPSYVIRSGAACKLATQPPACVVLLVLHLSQCPVCNVARSYGTEEPI